MKHKPTYPPLALVREFSRLLPGAWEEMADLHQSNHSPEMPSWPDWCYVPFAGAIAVTMKKFDIQEDLTNLENPFPVIYFAQALSALSIWRIEKHVFLVEPALMDELEKTTFGQIPSNIFMNLPYQSAYFEFEEKAFSGQSRGFFVHLEYDHNTKEQELRLSFIMENMQIMCISLGLNEDTIEDSIQNFYQTGLADLQKAGERYNVTQASIHTQLSYHKDSVLLLEKCLKIILYLCSDKPDIVPHSEQTFIMKRPNDGVISDRYSEIQKWIIGRQRELFREQNPGKVQKKRAYWRRRKANTKDSDFCTDRIKWYPPIY